MKIERAGSRLSAQSMAGSVVSSSSVNFTHYLNGSQDHLFMLCILSLSIVPLIPCCYLSFGRYKAPFRLSDISAAVPWLWLFWGLLFVKD